MAFLHCHKCGWSQDDFWSWSYNPARYFFIEMVPWLYRPRFVYLDSWATGQKKIHSWALLVSKLFHAIKKLFVQRWWTEHSWAMSKNRWRCPECHDLSLDVD